MSASGVLPGLLPGLWQRAERGLDAAAGGTAHNPLRHLGALGFLCFWLLAISGIVLYVVLDTSAGGAYRSVDAWSRQPWYLGGWLRSLHRYAADAFVVFSIAHLAREWLLGRYRGFRRFSWLTGVPLLLFVFACAIGGFWLNWDRLGQFSAIATAEWIDALPLLASPLTRNFLAVDAVSDRLFSLFVFVHLGVPLLLVFGLWFHVQRIARAAVFPPRPLALGMTAALIALSIALPVQSQGPADLSLAPATLDLDWWLLFVHPLMYATSPTALWIASAAVLALLLLLPFLPTRVRQGPVAAVDPANCNGCRRCFDDCPYAAITMVPHPNARIGRQLAVVDGDLCASCGICVGSCPSATPFRSKAELVTGIDMPQQPLDTLRATLQHKLSETASTRPIVVFGCDRGAPLKALADDGVVTMSLICIGQLPPSFIEYALRGGAGGVLVTGCTGCEFRLGTRWTEERLHALREPRLRASVPRERVAMVAADANELAQVRAALNHLRAQVAALPEPEPEPASHG
ncbi:MAG TPA: hydrogenase iron-sulfur subunit [Burkholderiaceae bacterium]|nr:hydrogenase iron-sulfur subunit [Burkholderiaceae bacterium]